MMCMMYAAVAALAIAAHGGGEEDEWRTVYSYGVGTTYANGAAAAVERNVRVLDAPSDRRRGGRGCTTSGPSDGQGRPPHSVQPPRHWVFRVSSNAVRSAQTCSECAHMLVCFACVMQLSSCMCACVCACLTSVCMLCVHA